MNPERASQGHEKRKAMMGLFRVFWQWVQWLLAADKVLAWKMTATQLCQALSTLSHSVFLPCPPASAVPFLLAAVFTPPSSSCHFVPVRR